MGVWIEIIMTKYFKNVKRSLPLWECGLKFLCHIYQTKTSSVTPFMGVWIEIDKLSDVAKKELVTPFMGVWIEIQKSGLNQATEMVTPFMGVWIEMRL